MKVSSRLTLSSRIEPANCVGADSICETMEAERALFSGV